MDSRGSDTNLMTEDPKQELPANELERQIFLVVYRSRKQRIRRTLAMLVLLLKYLVRGMLVIWPVYIVIAAIMLLPQSRQYVPYLALLTPGLVVWLLIYLKGARMEYRQRVEGRLLDKGFISELLKF